MTDQDEKYVKLRTALIPEAERLANLRLRMKKTKFELRPGADGRYYRHCFWSQYFHEAMDSLVSQYSLRG